MTRIKLLLIEDDEEDLELLSEILEEIESYEFEIIWASNYKNAIDKIQSDKYDLYIVDYLLGPYSGLEVCAFIKQTVTISPTILLTGKGDKNVDNKASEIGVNDYLVKREITATELERSIRYSIKQSEILTALKISESKYKSVLEQSQDILFIVDSNLKILSISDSLNRITGFNVNDLEADGMLMLFPESENKENIKNRIAQKESIYNLPTEIRCKNGEIKTVSLTCNYQIVNENADFIHGVIIDKTEEIRARQTQLVYEKLESTARFMRTLAHEVRNPLSNISMAIEGIEAEEDEVSPYVSIIKRNSGRIGDIVTRVLQSSHIEDIKFEKADIVQVLKNTIANVADKASLNRIAIQVNFSDEPYLISLNSEQLSLAISNILVNAIEALSETENGQIEISFDNNKLSIKDNGPGISKENLARIFEPYFTGKAKGVGLGLASSLSIFKAHNIFIELVSDQNSGANFILILPEKNKA